MKQLRRLFLAAAVLLMVSGAFAAEKVVVYHAGSLAAPMAKIEAMYEEANPGVDIQRESGGSAALARKITDLGGACDAFFSADYMVIEKLLRPATTDWNILFASNAIVLMYGPKSKYGEEIGRAREAIAVGEWIHLHNVYCRRGHQKQE